MKVSMEIVIDFDATIDEIKKNDKLEMIDNNGLAGIYAKAWKRMFDNILLTQGEHKKGDAVGVEVNKVVLYDTGHTKSAGIYQAPVNVKS